LAGNHGYSGGFIEYSNIILLSIPTSRAKNRALPMKIQNYPPSLWKTIKNTRFAWGPLLLGGIASVTKNYDLPTGIATGYVLISAADTYAGWVSKKKANLNLRKELRHELGHFIASLGCEDFLEMEAIEKHKMGYCCKAKYNGDSKTPLLERWKNAIRIGLSGRLLSRLSGKISEPLDANTDRLQAYRSLVVSPFYLPKNERFDLTKYYLIQARKDAKAILRQYPEKLIEEILDDMVHDFKDAPNGPVWSRENGKIQALEERLRSGKIKLDQAG